jgi:hypothetical protein
LSYGKELDFIVHFTGDRKIVIKNKLRYEKNQSFIVKSIPEEHITYNDFYETYCYPYILYILANSKIDFKGGNEEMFFKLEMIHPRDLGLNPSGIHKDNSCRTCLTYVNSPLSTELAFDIENIKLGWLTCSPIFRFDTLGKFFTLCFNDYYMTHTIPIYEEEGVPVEDTNFLQDNYEIKREGDKIFFIEDGKTDGEFLIPKYRQYVSKPSERKVIVCFIEETEEDDVEYTYETLLDFSSLNAHRLPYEEEKIELTEKSIQVILEEEKIGKAAQKGGKRTKKRRRRKNRNSKKR